MRLLIAGEIFEPDIGGPATYSKYIATELTKRGWDINLVCYSNKKQEDNYPFKVFRILRSPIKPLHYYKYFKQLKELAADTDLIYAQGPIGSGKPALKVKQQTGKKLVVKVVGDYAWEQARGKDKTDLGIDEFQNKKFGGKIGYLQKIQIQVCQGADRVIVPSQYLKTLVAGWGVNPDKIKIVYNAVDFPQIERQINQNEDLIVSIGRLVSWKGFSLLLEVFAKLEKINSKFKLVILGSGPEEDYLRSKIMGLGLNEKVIIKQVDSAERDEYLSQAKIFVLNTGYEGLSHTLLEAFAAGVPVITTNIGGNPEIVKDNVSGILIGYNKPAELEEAILRLNNDHDMQSRLSDQAKEALDRFTFEKMMADTITILQSI